MPYSPEMNINTIIWGRAFEIRVVFDVFPDEHISEQQIHSYEAFMNSKDKIFEDAYNKIKSYCLNYFSDYVDKDFKNIFSYVIPKSLYIRRENDDRHVVGIMCIFRYDSENQLVALVENECVTKIGNQDIIL